MIRSLHKNFEFLTKKPLIIYFYFFLKRESNTTENWRQQRERDQVRGF